MRELTAHRVNPANDKLTVRATDEPGAGGAHHRYVITGMDTTRNKTREDAGSENACVELLFQNGPIPESGTNGVTHEALLAVLIDRLDSFQAGPFACTENEKALSALLDAQHWLHKRTKDRMARNVEGTHKV